MSEYEFEEKWGSYLNSGINASPQLRKNIQSQERLAKFKRRYGQGNKSTFEGLSGEDAQLVKEEMSRRGIPYVPMHVLVEAAKGDIDPDDSRFTYAAQWEDNIASVKDMLPELRNKKLERERSEKWNARERELQDKRKQIEEMQVKDALQKAKEKFNSTRYGLDRVN